MTKNLLSFHSLCLFMKWTFIILTAVITSMLSAKAENAWAQSLDTRVNIQFKNISLKDALKQISKEVNIDFAYNTRTIPVDKRVSLSSRGEKLGLVLNKLLVPLNLEYRLEGTLILIEPKPVPVKTVETAPPDITIKGIVTDDKGVTLPGITVRLKGTTVSAATDANGVYTIKIPDPNATLVFTSIGYTLLEVLVNGKTSLNVVMHPNSSALNEVVVIGYGSARKPDLTGSVGIVAIQDLEKAPVTSFSDALAGRIAGVQVVSPDGQPGAAADIVIRGTGTLTSNSSPLYIIDGFPQESSDFSAINPNDIESITVLKDASSTAIYGARGANGVIIITTKRGKGTPKINYNGYAGLQSDINKVKLLSAYDFVKLQTEIVAAIGGAGNYDFVNNTYFTNGKTLDYYKNVKGIDWQDKLFQTAPFQNHSISISGQSGKTNYYISGNVADLTGLIVASGFKRYQGRLALDQQMNSHIKIGVSANYASTLTYGTVTNVATPTGNGGATAGSALNPGNAAYFNLMYNIWTYRPIAGSTNQDELLNTSIDNGAALLTGNAALNQQRINPYTSTLAEINNTTANSLQVNAYIEYKFLKDFTLRITGGVNPTSMLNEQFHNSQTRGGSPLTTQGQTNGVNGSEANAYANNYLNENTLTYNKAINTNNAINVVLGATEQTINSKGYGFSSIKLPNENLGVSGLEEGTLFSSTAVSTNNTLASFFSRVNYTLYQNYLFTGTIRADGSSKFAPGHQWGYFPSGAFAWRFGQEGFIKKLSFVDDAKLRVSYGITGNNRVGDFPYTSPVVSTPNYNYSYNNNVLLGSAPNAIQNPGLTWENAATFDLGLDITLYKGRIDFTTDYYNKKTTNLLLNSQISYSTGFGNAQQNIGSINNQGLEFTLNTVNIVTSKFKWSSNFNISFNRNRLLHLNNNVESLPTSSASGFDGTVASIPLYIAKLNQPVAQFYGYVSDGLYQLSDFQAIPYGGTIKYVLKDNVPYYGTKSAIQPGDLKYKDLNGDGVITPTDFTVIGNPFPIHIGGFSNNFTYKNFDLNVFFQWSYGNQVFNGNDFELLGGGTTPSDARFLGLNQLAGYANHWTFTNQDSPNPRVGANSVGTRAFSSRDIQDASFIRFKTLSLGYNLPNDFLTKMKIQSVRIYTSAQNLVTWTRYHGPDPEVSTRNTPLTPGFDYSPYPRTRVVTLGINATF